MRKLLLLLICFLGFISESNAGNNWTQRADYGNFGRHRAIAVGIGNRAYAGMGHINGSGVDDWFPDWWEYDPATNAWTQKADYIGNNGNGDQDLTAIAINGIGYIGLGQWSDEEHYKYDPSQNLWTQLNNAPNQYFSNTDPFVLNDKGYFPNGLTDSLYEYDPTLDTWTSVAAMPAFVGHRDGSFVINGKGYWKKSSQFWEFDPATYVWTQKASLLGTSYLNNNVGLSQGGYGFYVGGYYGWGDMCQNVWRYDPITDTWMQFEDFPGTARRWAVKAKIGDKCFFGLGTNGTNMNDWWEFDQLARTEEFTMEGFKAYPTLADTYVNFVSEDVNEFDIVITDMQGNIVNSINTINGKIRFDRNDISSGTYLYRVEKHGKVFHSGRFMFR